MKIFSLDRSIVIEDYYDLSITNNLQDSKRFAYECSRHEYYIVQLLLLPDYSTDKLSIVPGPLVSNKHSAPGVITCFNTEGVDNTGKKFTKTIPIKEGVLQPILIGCDFSRAETGKHEVKIRIGKENIYLSFELNDDLVFNEGVDSKTSLAKLKWLNSTIAKNIQIAEDLDALETSEDTIKFAGKVVHFSSDGLIKNAESLFNESNTIEKDVQTRLFYKPMELIIDSKKMGYAKLRIAGKGNKAQITSEGRGDGIRAEIYSEVFYEGALNYEIKITAVNDFVTQNIALNLFFDKPQFVVGVGGRARKIVGNTEFKWDKSKNQNEVFIGKINCGARIKLSGENESSTVVGYFKQFPAAPPDCWFNGGRGGMSLSETKEGAKLSVNTGRIILPAGDKMVLKFSILLTPFKELNLKKSLLLRIGRDQIEPTYDKMIDRSEKDGLTYMNITYGGEANPYLNFPFPYVKAISALARRLHEKGLGISLSYNLREISTQSREIYAYKALGDELLLRSGDESVTNAEQTKMLGSDVIIDKVVRYTAGKRKGTNDYAVIGTPSSRLDNYFIEGINYFIKNADIDAISMRDANLNRLTMERIKKIMGKIKGIPGIIEMQISDQYNDRCGYANSLNYYADILPFLDKVWLDRSFEGVIDDPSGILFEASGIPYGISATGPENSSVIKCLMFAMLPKYGLDQNTSISLGSIYKILNNFEVENATFYGHWDSRNPFLTDNPSVLCSCYKNGENMLVVVYNFSNKKVEFELGIESKLGYTSKGKKVYAPRISGEQRARKLNLGKSKKLKAGAGMVFMITEKTKKTKSKKEKRKFFVENCDE